eukprot:855603-Pleurochrysis_carterae.AAC.4
MITLLKYVHSPHRAQEVLEDVAVVQLEDQPLEGGDKDRAVQADQNGAVNVENLSSAVGALEGGRKVRRHGSPAATA